MTANKQEKANRLLEALVAHLSESLDPDRGDDWLEQELDALLAQADKVRLNEVVTAEQIGITVRKYAVQMELGGGIPELVGEMVDRLYNHGIQGERRVGELVDESTVAALVDKVLEIPLSRRGVGWLSSNPVLLALLAGGASAPWLVAVALGWVGILFVLAGEATAGLEKKQKEKYGGDARYEAWVKRTWAGPMLNIGMA